MYPSSDAGPNHQWGWLKAALAEFTEQDEYSDESCTLAAVLLLIYDKDQEPHIILTRRTERVQAHKGEISLPGGAYEPGRDASLLHTAMREAAEEVGIQSHSLQVLGRLPVVNTLSSNFAVTPFVATTAARPDFRADPFEVAEILEVPLAALRDPAALQEEDWELQEGWQRVSYYAYFEHKIWGATARILGRFLAVLEQAEMAQREHAD